jgi:hypothetical protein
VVDKQGIKQKNKKHFKKTPDSGTIEFQAY